MALPEPQTQQRLKLAAGSLRNFSFSMQGSAEAAGQENHYPVLALTLWEEVQKVWSAAGAENKLQSLLGGVPPAYWCM